jgi:nucleoside phosphorylase
MGARNAEQAIRRALTAGKPAQVFTCGFAGGLQPEFASGDVLFNAGGDAKLAACLAAAGARPGRFHCAARVAVSVVEKAALRAASGADAVEMESQIIASICREQAVPCAIVRVVLDTAGEDLPLDFNALMNADQKMNYARLAWAILKAPAKIGALMTLQKQSRAAAERLAAVLERALLLLRERTGTARA